MTAGRTRVPSKRRERQLARQRYLRRQEVVAHRRARQRRRNAVIASVLVVLLVAGGAAYAATLVFGGDDKPDNQTLASPRPTANASGEPGACVYTKAGNASKKVTFPSIASVDRTHTYTVTMRTNRGTVTFDMFGAKAPCTVNSFRRLAAQKYFDKTSCHRLTGGATLNVLQCGDPSGTGSGGPGYEFGDENLTGATYKAGTVAMANAGAGTNGSQFFLVYKDSQLNPNYTPFGR